MIHSALQGQATHRFPASRFLMDLVLPAAGLLRSPGILIDRRYGAVWLWLWWPVVLLVYFSSLDGGNLVPLGVLFAVMLFHFYLLTWMVLALYRAWKVSPDPVSRSLGIVLAIVFPLAMPLVGFFLHPHDGRVNLGVLNWIPLFWFVLVLGIGFTWRRITQRSAGNAATQDLAVQGLKESGRARVAALSRSRWRLWLVGLPLAIPAALAMALNVSPGLDPEQVPPMTRMIYAALAVIGLYLYVGLVLWPGHEDRVQPDAEDELPHTP